jgi:exonuclease SbcD
MPPIRILHCADVHLDRAFTDRESQRTGAARRAALRDAFLRIAERARDCDVLVVAGDLYEHEHVTGDTANMLAHVLGGLDCRVLLLPGNHDPHVPGSVYERTAWPPNVHVFRRATPEAVEVAPGVVVWGIAYTARELSADVVLAFRVPQDGRRHLLALHAAVVPSRGLAEQGHCPVTVEELGATGADAVLLGHFHDGAEHGVACYPGSPEPLSAGERGLHGVQLLEVGEEGLRRTLEPIARTSFEERTLDVTGAGSATEIEQRLRFQVEQLRHPGRTLTVTLTGEVEPVCEVRPSELARRCSEGRAALAVRDETRPAIDLDTLAEQSTAEGRFVRDMLGRALLDPERRDLYLDAARAGLRALAGQQEPVDVG